MQHSVPPGSGYSIVPQTPNHSNNPIYSQLFPADHLASRSMPDSPTPQTASVPFIPGGMIGSPATAGTAETVLKLDGRFKVRIADLFPSVSYTRALTDI